MINPKLVELFQKIQDDPKFEKEISKFETMGEIYEYCKTLVDGYTEEELGKFLAQLAALEEYIQTVPESELEKIAGGKDKREKSEFENFLKKADKVIGIGDKINTGAKIAIKVYYEENLNPFELLQLSEKLFQNKK